MHHVKSVTLDGLTVDGGAPYPFGWSNVWGGEWPLYHGNAAIAVAASGNITVRNCDLRNAYYGIAFKDRNEEGAFAIRNTHDINNPIPLGEFGSQGGHLVEYNRIYNNSIGYYSESSWDLGSTIRYNLFYNNFHSPATFERIRSLGNAAGNWDKVPGAILMRDHHLSPLAIYNNTFYGNAGNINRKSDVGGQHLLFNNIFSKLSKDIGRNNADSTLLPGGHQLEPLFPNRMYSSVMSSYNSIQSQTQNFQPNSYYPLDPPEGCIPTRAIFVSGLQFGINGINAPANSAQVFTSDNGCTGTWNAIRAGTAIPGFNNQLRWLQTEGYTVAISGGGNLTLPNLFQSVNPADADFLHPKWDEQPVIDFIKNKGWEIGSIPNSDGSRADLGAIPSVGTRAPIVARATPTTVVQVSGNSAVAKFHFEALDVINGTIVNLTDAKIRMLRWIAPLDSARQSNGYTLTAAQIRDIPAAVGTEVKMGSNTITVNIGTVPDGTQYGFFEMIIEGKDKDGETVISDVSFFPFTIVKYTFKVEVLNYVNGACGTQVQTEAWVGDPYCLRVIAQNANGTSYTGRIDRMKFSLFTNNQSSTLWNLNDTPLTEDNTAFNGGSKTWPVYFKTTGDEQIKTSGVYYVSSTQGEAFIGVGNIKVKTNKPERVVFMTPRPLHTLYDTLTGTYGIATTIHSGSIFDVIVGVTDRFGNLVDSDVPLKLDIVRQDPRAAQRTPVCNNVGRVLVPTANTDPITGIAVFQVQVDCGLQGEWFDMKAEITGGLGAGAADTARLRAGRTQNLLYIFFSDNQDEKENITSYYNAEVGINEQSGTKVEVVVKAANGGNVITGDDAQSQLCIVPTDTKIEVYTDAAGTAKAPASLDGYLVDLVDGEAKFWITANDNVFDECIEVKAVVGSCGAVNSIINAAAPRCGIFFEKPTSAIDSGVVFSGNGNGIPDSMIIYFKNDNNPDNVFGGNWKSLPDSVSLIWPTESVDPSGAVVGKKVTVGRIEGVESILTTGLHTVKVLFNPATSADRHEPGYTSVLSSGNWLGSLFWNSGADNTPATAPNPDDWKWMDFLVVERIGPVISARGDKFPAGVREGPMIIEKLSSAQQIDTLMIQASEGVFDEENILKGASIIRKNAAGIDTIEIITATMRPGDWLYLTFDGLIDAHAILPGDSIKFNASKGMIDFRGNPVLENNRWVEVNQKPTPPSIEPGSFYTNLAGANGIVNQINHVEIKFSKAVSVNVFDEFEINISNGPSAKGKVADMVAAGAIDQSEVNNGILRITDLSKAFPGIDLRNLTSGVMTLTISYDKSSELSKDWDNTMGIIKDNAAPVLVSHNSPDKEDYIGAVIKSGTVRSDGGFDPDTLFITYTERLRGNFQTSAQSLTFWRSGQPAPGPTLQIVSHQSIGGGRGDGWYRVAYLVPEGTKFFDDGSDEYLTTSDSISINNNAVPKIADEAGNEQAELNRKIAIRIESKVTWVVKTKNNPFTSKAGSGRNSVTVVFSPGVKDLREGQNIRVELMLYDYMGNVVRKDIYSKEEKVGEWKVTANNNRESSVEWVWRGHNRRGRLVGSGTYHLKAVMSVASENLEHGTTRNTEVRAIGFVR